MPASNGRQNLPADARFCFKADGVRIYSDDHCPNERRVKSAIESASLDLNEKQDIRVLVTSGTIICDHWFSQSCSDGWTVTVKESSMSKTIPHELKNLLAARLLGFTPKDKPKDNYENLPGWND